MNNETELIDDFINFIKNIKRKKLINERKYFLMFVHRRVKNLFFAAWLTFNTNEAERIVMKLQSLHYYNHIDWIQSEAIDKLNIPPYLQPQLIHCTSYNALINVLEKAKISLVERKYMVRMIDRNSGEIVGHKLASYKEAKEACCSGWRNSKIFFETDKYPVSKLMETCLQ